MKTKRDLDFKVNNSSDLNKMLTGLLMDVRRGEVGYEAAKCIINVADKINQNNVNILKYKQLTKHNKNIPFFEYD